MNERADLSQPSFSIAAVERDTGLPKDTLRVWEKRYNFPQPGRDSFGERIYSIDQVEKLRVIKRLLDGGHRPGKIIGLSIDELVKLAEVSSAGSRMNVAPDSLDELNGYMELIKRHDAEEFRQAMSRLALTMGLRRFVVEIVAPMNAMVGDAWARGYFEIFEEHIYTETIQVVLRNALNTIPSTRKGPRVLLTTLPNELHGLGLLMAECIFPWRVRSVFPWVRKRLFTTSYWLPVRRISISWLCLSRLYRARLQCLRRSLSCARSCLLWLKFGVEVPPRPCAKSPPKISCCSPALSRSASRLQTGDCATNSIRINFRAG